MATDNNRGLYRGHPIFQNRPSYTLFNKSFEDTTDALYLGLNEIHPLYLQPAQLEKDAAIFRRLDVLLDPRTKQKVTQTYYDHTQQRKTKLFNCANRSAMTAAQQAAGLRVLRAWQERSSVDEADLLMWRCTEGSRQKEKQNIQKLAFEYAQAHKEQMYAPVKTHVELYKRWYARQQELLLRAHPNEVAYNTHTGLPHVRVCRCPEENYKVEITGVHLAERNGWLPLLPTGQLPEGVLNLAKLHRQLESYCGVFNNDLAPLITTNSQRNLAEASRVAAVEDEDANATDTEQAEHLGEVVAPLEAILFLLTAGDYIDTPAEMHMDIEAAENDSAQAERKRLLFAAPLPSRNCGWHTHNLMLQHAYEAYVSVADGIRWLKCFKDVVQLQEAATLQEIEAGPLEHQTCFFKPVLFEDYMARFSCQEKNEASGDRQLVKRNEAVVDWRLRSTSDEAVRVLHLRTTLTMPAALNADGTALLASQCVKLEYKPQFGCEIMTKYDLLREWLRLRLLPGDCDETKLGQCLRLAAPTGEKQLHERYTLLCLEQQLSEMYHVNITQLVANLMEFLRLLLRMPAGTYLLRYNPKFRDKLMLCAPTREITANTVHLHALLLTEPSDLAFMTQPHFLPIADDLCSVVHEQHQTLPCAFLPPAAVPPQATSKQPRRQPAHALPTGSIFNDREQLLTRMQQRADQRQQLFKKKHRTAGKKKASRKAKRKKEQAAQLAAQKDELELKMEIELDEMLFGL